MKKCSEMSHEDFCRAGICPDCHESSRKWTDAEILEAKEDLGMTTDDDFSACCEKCFCMYEAPHSRQASQRHKYIKQKLNQQAA